MANITDLPTELIVAILSHLDIRDIEAVGNTCQALRHIITDQELWKHVFKTRMGTSEFSSVSRSTKFNTELFEREAVIKGWRRAKGSVITIPLNARNLTTGAMQPSQLACLNGMGSVHVALLDTVRRDYEIPLDASLITSVALDHQAVVYGTETGRVYIKHISKKNTWGGSIEVRGEAHEAAITCCAVHGAYCYTGDNQGVVVVAELKTGAVVAKYKVSNFRILRIKGRGEVVVALDTDTIYVVNDYKDGEVKKVHYNPESPARHFDVDFPGSTIVFVTTDTINLYSFQKRQIHHKTSWSTNGGHITDVALEQKEYSARDTRVAGADGCNLAVVVSEQEGQEVVVFNSRAGLLKPQTSIVPTFNEVFLVSPVTAIDINAAVVLIASYNGWASVYDTLTGKFIRSVSSKLPKKYLSWNDWDDFQWEPTRFAKLGKSKELHGTLAVRNCIQYFKYGEEAARPKKKSVVGANNERKDRLKRTIQTQMYDLEHLSHEELVKEELVRKFNGSDVEEGDDLEMAIALNKSLHEHVRGVAEEDVDEDLAQALEMSKLEFEQSRLAEESFDTSAVEDEALSHEVLDDDEEFQRQLEEALKRSLHDEYH